MSNKTCISSAPQPECVNAGAAAAVGNTPGRKREGCPLPFAPARLEPRRTLRPTDVPCPRCAVPGRAQKYSHEYCYFLYEQSLHTNILNRCLYHIGENMLQRLPLTMILALAVFVSATTAGGQSERRSSLSKWIQGFRLSSPFADTRS